MDLQVAPGRVGDVGGGASGRPRPPDASGVAKPGAPVPETPRETVLETVLVVVPPVLVCLASPESPPWLLAILAVPLGFLLRRPLRLSSQLVLAAVALVLVSFAVDRATALSLVVSWSQLQRLRRVAPPGGSSPGQLMGPLVGTCALIYLVVEGPGAASTIVLAQVAMLLLLFSGAGAVSALEVLARIVTGAVDLLVGALRVATMGLLFLVSVAIPWLAQRLLAVDPLERGGARGWMPLSVAPARPGSPWGSEAVEVPVPIARRMRNGASAVVALVITGALAWFVVDRLTEPYVPPVHDEVPAAVADLEWYEDLSEVQRWMGLPGEGNVGDPFGPYRVGDMSSDHVNVEDGVRRSWLPPPCESCRTVTVWMYGGSTTFGVGQRDEHTIPSELARLAGEDGLRVEVVNRGQPADMHWQEAQRFAWDVVSEQPPDLVVFYDGTNEMWAASVLNDRGMGTVESLWNPEIENAKENYDRAVMELPGFVDLPTPGGVVVPEEPTGGERLDAETLARHTMARYERSLSMSRAAVEQAAVPTLWFWQPCLWEPGHVDGEPEQLEFMEEGCVATRELLPEGVIDLTDALDGRDEPVFLDAFHTNEVGARMAAEVLYGHLAPELRGLSESGGDGG